MSDTTPAIITEIGSALGHVLDWVGDVIGALVNSGGHLNALLPVFAITIGISLLLFGIKIVRSLTYGA